MFAETNYLVLASLLISIFAAAISLVRYTSERVQRQAATTVNAYYDIVKLIDNDRTVESRGAVEGKCRIESLQGRRS